MYGDSDRIGKLNAVYRKLVKRHSVLLHEVIKMAYPQFVDSPPINTAAVGQLPDGRIMYYWNRAFFDRHKRDDLTYIAAHETLHIILAHPLRCGDRDPYRWNIACDLVVNTLLDCRFGLPCTKALSDRILAKSFGYDPYDILKMRAEDIYDMLPDNIRTFYIIDSHELWDSLTEDQINDLRHRLSQSKSLSSSSNYGLGSGGEMETLNEVVARPYPWQRLLRGRLASIKKPRESESWARANRKIYQYYPKVLLPGPHEGESVTSTVFAVIDTSGSMSTTAIAELAGILASLPRDDYEVTTAWFDTDVYDMEDVCRARGRGGTNFQCIEEVSKGLSPIKTASGAGKKFTRYPDVVIAMTDGHASTPNLQHANRWVWMLPRNGSGDYAIKGLGSTIMRV
jgi:predicted metal-dependent peptidase